MMCLVLHSGGKNIFITVIYIYIYIYIYIFKYIFITLAMVFIYYNILFLHFIIRNIDHDILSKCNYNILYMKT